MTRHEYRRDLAKYRWNTMVLMRRYRYPNAMWVAIPKWTEAELRAAWGDR